MGREVAESCVDGIVMEMVSAYSDRFYATKPELAARRIEAIGYQVGLQLSERCASILPCLYCRIFLCRCVILQGILSVSRREVRFLARLLCIW